MYVTLDMPLDENWHTIFWCLYQKKEKEKEKKYINNSIIRNEVMLKLVNK